MIDFHITANTPANMLRAIRAACNELLGEMPADLTTQAAKHVTRANELQAAADAEAHKAAAALSAHNRAVGEPPSEQTVAATDTPPHYLVDDHLHETDSAGHTWNAELHASTKSKNADGTWKKRRGAGGAVTGTPGPEKEGTEILVVAPNLTIQDVPNTGVVQTGLPPLPPPPPSALVTMNDIYALIQNHKCVLNDVIAAAQAMGFADVGAFSRDATPEQRAQLLQELTA